jgi:hypothetical protein
MHRETPLFNKQRLEVEMYIVPHPARELSIFL